MAVCTALRKKEIPPAFIACHKTGTGVDINLACKELEDFKETDHTEHWRHKLAKKRIQTFCFFLSSVYELFGEMLTSTTVESVEDVDKLKALFTAEIKNIAKQIKQGQDNGEDVSELRLKMHLMSDVLRVFDLSMDWKVYFSNT